MARHIQLPSLRCIRYEVAINGWRILKHTVNDFSLWRLIEYPWVTSHLRLQPGDTCWTLAVALHHTRTCWQSKA